MNTHTLTPVSVHFDDCDWSFDAVQNANGGLFVTEATYQRLQREGHIDGGADVGFGPASDYAPPVDELRITNSLRDISGWEVNFDDSRVHDIGRVGGHSNREWCSIHKQYANEPWNGTTCND